MLATIEKMRDEAPSGRALLVRILTRNTRQVEILNIPEAVLNWFLRGRFVVRMKFFFLKAGRKYIPKEKERRCGRI
jgi:hypothetical protein